MLTTEPVETMQLEAEHQLLSGATERAVARVTRGRIEFREQPHMALSEMD